eukprot:CAMPEP_0172328374 /NCGR_PEP_ID=MMETSP1058-20130122/60317_1 /TAXON_ID=83371 /ORGANISM="Detonula confervacea, Strain CCMP 353" /LENGTH=1083 /DNA_ID=CAMNT_0013045487 /DNA_START=93 /DNA_END=3345 /DNA_ORIENTATION=+
MTEDTSGDIENPKPSVTADLTPSPNVGGGKTSNNDPHKKWKVIALSTFLLAAVVLAIALGVTLGNDGGSDLSANVSTNKEDTDSTQPTQPVDNTTTSPTVDVSAPQVYKSSDLSANVSTNKEGESGSGHGAESHGTVATCLVGDIMHSEGDSIGHIGWECLNSTSYDGTASTCGPDGQIIETEMEFKCSESVPYCVQCGPRGRGAALCLSTPTTDRDCDTDSTQPTQPVDNTTTSPTVDVSAPQVYKTLCLSTPTTDRDCGTQTFVQPNNNETVSRPAITNTTTTPSTSSSATNLTDTNPNEDTDSTQPTQPVDNTTTSPTVDVSAPQVYKTQYLESNGPILSKVRIISPAVAQGYNSCDELRDDILNALKHYANSIIVRESKDDWYEKCDPNATNNYYLYAEDDVMLESVSMEAAPPESSDSQEAGKVKEDSYETNNQVDGVDEADIVKSDGDYVYAAYGDLLYVWNATDGTKGISITKMPSKEIDAPEPDLIVEEMGELSPTVEIELSDSTESSPGGKRHRRDRHRKTSSIWYPCYKRKPGILSLLLRGSRLTVIVSEDTNRPGCYEKTNEESEPILSDYSKLTIKVYDVSDVPTDGSPLKLVGEKEIKGNYKSARSVDDTGFVITTTNVNTGLFATDLNRWNSQYCGLNSTEYVNLAAEIAVNNTEPFMNRMLNELQLQLDGTCDSIFQVAAMQSGDSTEDRTSGDMLGSFVQVLSFNMSSDFVNEKISTNVAGGFSSGWLHSVYASQEFAGALSVGSNYNKATGEWDESTFILGFDISGGDPLPFAYAEVRGQPLNEYSVDMYGGHLRVVTTERQWSSSTRSTTNKLFIFKVPTAGEGPEMRLTGVTEHLGKPNEEVKAVRFIGDRAYIVTFETTDPFYVFDLTNPSDPKKLGELEIPGFSSYLHPVEIDGVQLMLGVGQNANETTGRTDGVKISLFDISDPRSPTENATFVDKGAYSSAGNDYKAFRYLPLSKKLILPKSEYTGSEDGNFDGFVVYDIDVDEITPSYDIQHASSYRIYRGCWYGAYMPARSFVFQSKLTTILSHSVISTDLETGEKLWNFTLDEGLDNTDCSPYFIGF